MNKLEKEALLADLRRRGDKTVRADEISCTIEEYRAGARRIGRQQGWRINTVLINGGAGVVVAWMDRPTTALEAEALRRTLGEIKIGGGPRGGTYDRMLEQVRRENLTAVCDEDEA